MKIISSKKKLLKYIGNAKNIGFVPTMGSLHKGHESLIKKSLSQCSKTLVSIYINRPQFNKSSDYNKYPRNLKKDISILKKLKVDLLYLPLTKEIYSKKYNKKIKIDAFSRSLCGKFRPGHFNAVVDVIYRFIKIIEPKKIFLGEKDMQQLKLIENFFYNNKIKTKVVPCRTIRENNGIACSSRNLLLNKIEKKNASRIYKFLFKNKSKVLKKKVNINTLINIILNLGANKIDYIKLINVNKIIKPYKKKKRYKIFFAYYINKTRLIDNI